MLDHDIQQEKENKKETLTLIQKTIHNSQI